MAGSAFSGLCVVSKIGLAIPVRVGVMAIGSNALSGQVSIVQDLRVSGSESILVRVLRDMTLCAGGTVLGARLDGSLAYFTMQSICAQAGSSPISSIMVHLQLLPATSVLMIAVAMACQWPGRGASGQSLSSLQRILRWSAFAVRTGLLFFAMMLAMSFMQPVALKVLPASPSSAVLASVVGMMLLAILSAGLRPLLLRVPFLVPLCCR